MVCNSMLIIKSTHEKKKKKLFSHLLKFLPKKSVPTLCFYTCCMVESIEC